MLENIAYNQHMGRKLTKPRPKLGEHLAAIRMKAGLSQEELAKKIGMPQQNIAYWEQSDKPPRSEVLMALADVLKVKVETLLLEDGSDAMKKKVGPEGKLRKIFEEASNLPRRQQEKIAEFVSVFVKQYAANE
jgi:transcriptional regulator with XRE-family HTH domain